MRSYLIFSVTVFIMVLAGACETEPILDCSGCYTTRPVEGRLKVKLNPNKSDDGKVIIFLYQGTVEDGLFLMKDSLTYNSQTWEMQVSLNQYYSARCVYLVDGEEYHVVDGEFFKAKKIDYLDCEEDCWTIRGGSLNCKLKN